MRKSERRWAKSGLSLAGLELEITEGVLIEDVLRAKKTMQSLKSLGILIALDDFGTGYSSLSYHRGLPSRPDQDLSGIRCLAWTERAIVGHRSRCHRLAQGLGVPVLAEGIETKAQMSLLVQEGSDEMQGYLIGPRSVLRRKVGPSRGSHLSSSRPHRGDCGGLDKVVFRIRH